MRRGILVSAVSQSKTYSPQDLCAELKNIVGEENFFSSHAPEARSASHYARHNPDKIIGACLAVVKPKNRQVLSDILKLVNEAEYPDGEHASVVVQGGNTSTSRQSTPQGRQIVIQMDHFNTIHYDPKTGNIDVGAGVTIDQAQEHISIFERQLPVRVGVWQPNATSTSLHGTTLAGMYMTNAGGPDAIHYGMAGDHVMACEVMRADGTVIQIGSDFPSDNTCLQLRKLLAGSNGTLGIVTHLKVKTVPQEKQAATIVFEPGTLKNIPDIINKLELYHDQLCGLEYISGPTLQAYLNNDDEKIQSKATFRKLFPDGNFPKNGIVLVKFALPRDKKKTAGEASGKNEAEEALEHLDDDLQQARLVKGNVIHGQPEAAWSIRRNLFFTNNSPDTSVVVMDVSVRRSQLMDFCPELEQRVQDALSEQMRDEEMGKQVSVCFISHLGSNVLHPNIVIPQAVSNAYPGGQSALEQKIEQVAYRLVGEYRGVASAEHGMGPENMAYILTHMDPGLFREHLTLNAAHDPNDILNPHAKVSISNLQEALIRMGMEESQLSPGLQEILDEWASPLANCK